MYDIAADPGETLNLYGDPAYKNQQRALWDRMVLLQAQVPERPKIGI
jgi:hypothetical protein